MVANKRSTCSHKIRFSSPTLQFVKQPMIFFRGQIIHESTYTLAIPFFSPHSKCLWGEFFYTGNTSKNCDFFWGSYDFDATESSCVCQRAEEFPTFSRVSYGVIHSDKESNFCLVQCTLWIIISEEYPSYGHLRWPTILNDTAISQLKLSQSNKPVKRLCPCNPVWCVNWTWHCCFVCESWESW